MATGQGYRLSLYIGDDPLDFDNCNVNAEAEEIPTDGSLVVDEDTGDVLGFNGAYGPNGEEAGVGPFSDCAGGLQTLTIDFNDTIRNPLALSYFALLKQGDKLPDQVYQVWYNGRLVYYGVGLYVRNVRTGAVVRGSAQVTFTLRSTQYGFKVNSALALS